MMELYTAVAETVFNAYGLAGPVLEDARQRFATAPFPPSVQGDTAAAAFIAALNWAQETAIECLVAARKAQRRRQADPSVN
jgi:hypothetical protein